MEGIRRVVSLIALVILVGVLAGCTASPPVEINPSSGDFALNADEDVRLIVHRGVPSPPTFVNVSIENGGESFGRFNLWANESTGHITFPVRPVIPVHLVPPGGKSPSSLFVGVAQGAPLGVYKVTLEAVAVEGETRLKRVIPVRVEPAVEDALEPGSFRLEATHGGSIAAAGTLVEIPVELTIDGSWSRWVGLFVEGPHATADVKRVVVEPGTPTRTTFAVHLARSAPVGVLDLTVRAETETGLGLIAFDSVRLDVGRPDVISSDLLRLDNVTVRGSPDRLHLIPGSTGEVTVTVRNEGGEALSVTLASTGEVPLALGADTLSLPPSEARTLALAVGPVPLETVPGLEIPLYVEVGLPGGGPDPRAFAVATLVVHDPSTPLPDDTLGTTQTGPDSTLEDPVVVVGAVGGVGLLGALAFLRRRDAWRYLFMAPFAGLYTRLARKAVLGHAIRDGIHARIVQAPGIHYSQLLEDTRLSPGVLVHHLRTLERHAYVQSRREGTYRRFYPAGSRLPVLEADPLTAMQRRVLATLETAGPLTQAQLAERLGMTKQGVSYHLRGLARRGEVVAEDGPGALLWRRVAKAPIDHQRP